MPSPRARARPSRAQTNPLFNIISCAYYHLCLDEYASSNAVGGATQHKHSRHDVHAHLRIALHSKAKKPTSKTNLHSANGNIPNTQLTR